MQRTLGPDTRVSARAELLSPDHPEAGADAHESTRMWTGAWNSQQQDLGGGIGRPYKNDRNGRFLSWLVSLPPAEAGQIDRALTPMPGATIPLAEIQLQTPAGSPERYTVRAPAVPVNNNTGQFAWWISDEGVKANPRLHDPYLGASQTGIEDIPRILYPHRENFSATRWFENTDFNEIQLIENMQKAGAGTNSPALALENSLLSPEALAALSPAGTGTAGDSLLADFTLHSAGVLGNPKTGGLKKDLTLAFWRAPRERSLSPTSPGFTRNEGFFRDFSNRTTLHGRIFNQEDYPGNIVRATASRSFFGPQWDVLRDYHNSFQKLSNPAAAVPAAEFETILTSDNNNRNSRGMFGGSNEQDSLHRVGRYVTEGNVLRPISGSGNPNTARVDGFVNNALFPVITSAEFFFSFDVEQEGTVAPGIPQFGPRLNLFVAVNLWNPHNVALSTQTLTGSTATGYLLNPYFGQISFDITNTTTGESVNVLLAEFVRQTDLTVNQNTMSMEFRIPSDPSGINFLPGEVRQYRLSTGTELSPVFSETPLLYPLNTIPGKSVRFNPGHGMRVAMNVDDILDSNIGSNFRMDYSTFGPGVNSTLQFFRFAGIIRDPDLTLYEDFGTIGPTGLDGDPLHVGTVEHALKAANEPDTASPNILAAFTPRSVYPGGALVTGYEQNQSPNYLSRIVPPPSSFFSVPAERDGTRVRGFWGNSRQFGTSSLTLFDVPRLPPESIGQYQHAALAIFAGQPAYALGNSTAHPHVRREFAQDIRGTNNATQIDLSWFLNDAIWDDYFLSTLDLDAAGTGSTPLRQRFRVLNPALTFSVANPDDYLNVAANLLYEGAFNINSTSVEAWTAFLSALGGPSDAGDLDFPYHRLSVVPSETPNTGWTGAPRNLTRAEIRTLAEEMVNQVRLRGPFLSLSDFVNRRLSNDDLGLAGALQAALDAAGVNNILPPASAGSSGTPVPAHILPNAAALAPGDISQADVLTTLAPKMSARSDTFIIRSYGSVLEPSSGSIQSQSWSEMLVQRIPEEHPDSRFGRRFRVLNTRTLTEDQL